MLTKFIIWSLGIVATLAILLLVLRIILLIGGVCGTFRIFSTMKKTWQGLRSDQTLIRSIAQEQLFLNGMSLLFLGIGLTIIL